MLCHTAVLPEGCWRVFHSSTKLSSTQLTIPSKSLHSVGPTHHPNSSLDPCCFFTPAPCDRQSLQILRNSGRKTERSKWRQDQENLSCLLFPVCLHLASQECIFPIMVLKGIVSSALQRARSRKPFQISCICLPFDPLYTLSEPVLKFARHYLIDAFVFLVLFLTFLNQSRDLVVCHFLHITQPFKQGHFPNRNFMV